MEIDQEHGLTVCQRRPMELSPQRERPPKMPRTDVMALAQQISEADNFVQANLCNKLKPIADQMNFLRQQAFQVLESAQRDVKLHHTQCSFKKVAYVPHADSVCGASYLCAVYIETVGNSLNVLQVPGQIYHLYEKLSGEQYMSMLSPEEWAVTTGPAQTHLGSFRLESDQSWTPAQDVAARDTEMLAFRQFMQREDALPALMGSKRLF